MLTWIRVVAVEVVTCGQFCHPLLTLDVVCKRTRRLGIFWLEQLKDISTGMEKAVRGPSSKGIWTLGSPFGCKFDTFIGLPSGDIEKVVA